MKAEETRVRRLGAGPPTQRAPRHAFMFLWQLRGLMFRLLRLPETPKPGGRFAFIRLGVSLPNFNPIAMATLPATSEAGGDRTHGAHRVLCRCLERTGFTLGFFLFIF